jgi:hypothetical protein
MVLSMNGLEDLGIADGALAMAALVVAVIAVSYSSSPGPDGRACKVCGSTQQTQVVTAKSSATTGNDACNDVTDGDGSGSWRCVMGVQGPIAAATGTAATPPYLACTSTPVGTSVGTAANYDKTNWMCQSANAYKKGAVANAYKTPTCSGTNRKCNGEDMAGIGWFGSSGSS